MVLREISYAVEHALCTLSAYVGTQRNRFCAINNLPAEILRQIFLSACEYGLRWRDLASIIETCKPWYNIVARDPAAYCTINVGDYGCSLHVAEASAERSAPLPLSIAWTDTGMGTSISDPNWKGEFCAEHLSRIKTLAYAQLDTVADEWLHELPAPQLERCELSRFADDEDEDEDADEDEDQGDSDWWHGYILPSLFSGNTPKLRSLTLHGVRLAWRPGNYSDLTHLIITFHPKLLVRSKLDTDYIAVIFQDSPRLEHVDFRLAIDKGPRGRAPKGISIFVRDRDRPRSVMRHLHTLRMHFPTLILVLRTIQITSAIKTIDLDSVCDSNIRSDERSLQILDTGVLPDFLLAKLQSVSLGHQSCGIEGDLRCGLSGSGRFGGHEYSLFYSFPDLARLAHRIGPSRKLLELKHIRWYDWPDDLTTFLAIAPAVDEIHLANSVASIDSTAKALVCLMSNPRNHPYLSRISHWAFVGDVRIPLRLSRRDINSLKAFFRCLPPRRTRRTLSLDGPMKLEYEDGLHATREMVVDFARLNVAFTGLTKFDVGWDDYDQYNKDDWVYIHTYTSAESLWPDDEVPDVVREVMKE